jgi:hypothetical protein
MQSAYTRKLALMQGGYFLLTGLWPLVHFRSFEAVTGPKPEPWLVKMVGLLAASIGLSLVRSARRPQAEPRELRLLATTSAASFAAIDLWYAGRRRISPVYLVDAAIEMALVGAWLLPRRQTHGREIDRSG